MQRFFVATLVHFAILTIKCFINSTHQPDIKCRDPRTGSASPEHVRQYLVFGKDWKDINPRYHKGLGNILSFFPAAYYYAVFTGRDILLSDAMGYICKIGDFKTGFSLFHGDLNQVSNVYRCLLVRCDFPFFEDTQSAQPHIFTPLVLKDIAVATFEQMVAYAEGNSNLSSHLIVRAFGYERNSQWWRKSNAPMRCVERLTGCSPNDFECADRYAYQTLIRGPFLIKTTKRIHGLPHHIARAILNLPHSFAPRFDVAVHLRCQFNHFEKFIPASDAGHTNETNTWLNSDEKRIIFPMIKQKIVDVIRSQREQLKIPLNTTAYVYLASDNEDVKKNLTAELRRVHVENSDVNSSGFELKVVRIEGGQIHHVNGMPLVDELADLYGTLFDLVFDWYALSLSKVIITWRRDCKGLLRFSTFAQSAQLMASLAVPDENSTSTSLHSIEGHFLAMNKAGTVAFWERFRDTD